MAVFSRILAVFSVDLVVQTTNVVLAHRAKLTELVAAAPPMLSQSAQREIARERCAE
jgi:hypothetical protein